MTREQILCQHLKNQAQVLFWEYEASGQPLASHITVSAYKASLLEFFEYAAKTHHLGKITQIRKRHLLSYIHFLKKRSYGDFAISKRIYAICFWLEMVRQNDTRLPTFEGLCTDYPEIAQARFRKNRK